MYYDDLFIGRVQTSERGLAVQKVQVDATYANRLKAA